MSDDLVVLVQISLIHRVNKIYRKTDFGQGYTNMGFEIRQVSQFLRACRNVIFLALYMRTHFVVFSQLLKFEK